MTAVCRTGNGSREAEAMTSDDNWIEVADNPPPIGLPVILTDGVNVAEGYRTPDGYRRHYGDKWAELDKYGNNFLLVTHWQYMPKPPRRR